MNNNLKFMDFCSGIGGGRLGLEANGMECVGHSEIDKETAKTYNYVFDDDNNFGDLMHIKPDTLPDFDVMIAGFPCQTFSIVGKRAGLNDDRGMVIHGIANILKEKDVKYFIFENVKGLINHNKGKTLQYILGILDNAGYHVKYKLLNSINYGVPQMRERIYLIGSKKSLSLDNFSWIKEQKLKNIQDYLIADNDFVFDINNPTFVKYLNNKYNQNKYNINEILEHDFTIIDWRQSDLRIYKKKCPTLRTGRHGILYVKNRKLYKLSSLESLLLQGFPLEYAQEIKNYNASETKTLSQAGNAMTVNVIYEIGKSLKHAIANQPLNVDKEVRKYA